MVAALRWFWWPGGPGTIRRSGTPLRLEDALCIQGREGREDHGRSGHRGLFIRWIFCGASGVEVDRKVAPHQSCARFGEDTKNGNRTRGCPVPMDLLVNFCGPWIAGQWVSTRPLGRLVWLPGRRSVCFRSCGSKRDRCRVRAGSSGSLEPCRRRPGRR